MVEFVVVGPLITVLGLAILQYVLLFNAKGQMNHAAFMAARAGSVANARLGAIEAEYKRALIPLYGGGRNATELEEAYERREKDLAAGSLRFEVLNPTKESFDDHATDAELNKKYGARAIPNAGIALRPDPDAVGPRSGQTLQDANLLKLRITQGYEPKVWIMGLLYKKYLQWMDVGEDEFNTRLIDGGRVPIVTHVTLEMQSDAVEAGNVSFPGPGNGGVPNNPGDPLLTDRDSPRCFTMGCTVTYTPADPGSSSGNNGGGSGGDGGNGPPEDGSGCSGGNCPVCGA